MTKNHKKLTDSTWFTLVGDKFLMLGIFAFLAPSMWALNLLHSGQVVIGLALLTGCTGLQGRLLWELDQRKYLRLVVSGPCMLLGLLSIFLFVWQT
jgi:hypothetical protein